MVAVATAEQTASMNYNTVDKDENKPVRTRQKKTKIARKEIFGSF